MNIMVERLNFIGHHKYRIFCIIAESRHDLTDCRIAHIGNKAVEIVHFDNFYVLERCGAFRTKEARRPEYPEAIHRSEAFYRRDIHFFCKTLVSLRGYSWLQVEKDDEYRRCHILMV